MAEAEDVIVDVVRHATNYAHGLWQRNTRRSGITTPSLAELAPRLTLLITAATGRAPTLRVAQPPAPRTLLSRLFRRSEGPRWTAALPATDGVNIWLPSQLKLLSADAALEQYRVVALQQAMRVARDSARFWPGRRSALLGDLYLLFEALAADADLVRALPGMAVSLRMLRAAALRERPPLQDFPPPLRALESLLRRECSEMSGTNVSPSALTTTPSQSLAKAELLEAELRAAFPGVSFGSHPLYKDLWLGELRAPALTPQEPETPAADLREGSSVARSAHLPRPPEARQAEENEDQAAPGTWMVQTSEPQEKAEDPHGLQRPTDRDDAAAPDELADALSELPEARLVSTASRPREFLLSDDPPEPRSKLGKGASGNNGAPLTYPEWDYRIGAYHFDAVTVRVVACGAGTESWIEQTLARHRGLLQQIRRQFELLRAGRSRIPRQVDGDEIDLEAYLESKSDFRAGLPLADRVYQTQRRVHRDVAIVLLVDVSGSTDSWVAAQRRIIDVEREALLLVCVALEGLMQPYAVQAFSGDGPEHVTIRNVKGFNERVAPAVLRRIASLEPEQYTRVGAAVRHATTLLMGQQARHRLLLLLSDGKPNDVDQYSGRYGVEDFRQSVAEAKLQGVSPFCLTIDRHAASYLPFVFGAGHYALLTRPELLPIALVDWVRRLVAA